MTVNNVVSLNGSKKIFGRERIKKTMEELLKKLSEYYGDEIGLMNHEVEHVRRGDIGAVGDLSVIFWAGGQLAVYKSTGKEKED